MCVCVFVCVEVWGRSFSLGIQCLETAKKGREKLESSFKSVIGLEGVIAIFGITGFG